MYTGYQKVKLKRDLPQKKLSKGTIGTIVTIHKGAENCEYEIGFSAQKNSSRLWLASDLDFSQTAILHENDFELIFDELQMVKLKIDLPHKKLTAGTIGTVVMVYDSLDPEKLWAYEVEFCDENGFPLTWFGDDDPESTLTLTLSGSDIESV